MINSNVGSIRVLDKNGVEVYYTEFAEISAGKALTIMAHHAKHMPQKWAIRFTRDKNLFNVEGTTLVLKPLSVMQQIKCGFYVAHNKHREHTMTIEEGISSWSETLRFSYNLRHTA